MSLHDLGFVDGSTVAILTSSGEIVIASLCAACYALVNGGTLVNPDKIPIEPRKARVRWDGRKDTVVVTVLDPGLRYDHAISLQQIERGQPHHALVRKVQ